MEDLRAPGQPGESNLLAVPCVAAAVAAVRANRVQQAGLDYDRIMARRAQLIESGDIVLNAAGVHVPRSYMEG